MAGEDIKQAALNSAHDYYELLEVAATATESEIRRAYRRTALKYHPDKVGTSDVAAREKFDLLQLALEILTDPGVRPLYDNARRAREEKKLRESAYDAHKKQLKDDLERRERAGVAGLKRPSDPPLDDGASFQQKLNRLAADGARRREQRTEQSRKEARESRATAQEELPSARPESFSVQSLSPSVAAGNYGPGVSAPDRTIKLRYSVDAGITDSELNTLFAKFGHVALVYSREGEARNADDEKKRQYTQAVIEFRSIVGAYAAMTDYERQKNEDGSMWAPFRNVEWEGGEEPKCIADAVRSEFGLAQKELTMMEVTRLKLIAHQKTLCQNAGSWTKERTTEFFIDAKRRSVPKFRSFPTHSKTIRDAAEGHSHTSSRSIPSFGSFPKQKT